MARTIWKFTAPLDGEDLRVVMPAGARVLHATMTVRGPLPHTLTAWAVVDTNAPKAERTIRVRGTGQPLGSVGRHITTVLDGPFVWHIFDDEAEQR